MKNRIKTIEGFDCLAFKRQAQAEIYEDIKNLDHQQEREYLRNRAGQGSLGTWWKRIARKGEEARQ